MNNKADRQLPSINWSGPLRAILVVAMLLPFLTILPKPSSTEAASRIHPALMDMAAKHPDLKVDVIVQKSTKDNGPEQMTTKLGGTVTGDLHIINAFTAQMSAKAVSDLAAAAGIRWISLDAPVSDTSTLGGPKNTPTPTRTVTNNTPTATATATATNTPTATPTPAGPSNGFISWSNSLDFPASSEVSSNFNTTAIPSGSYIWFTAVVSATGLSTNNPVTIRFHDGEIRFGAGGVQHKLAVPDAKLSFEPNAPVGAETGYNNHTNLWSTAIRTGTPGSFFLTGMVYRAPSNLTGIGTVTWKGAFSTDTPGVQISWQWSAAVYTNFGASLGSLNVKPCNGATCSQYNNSNLAGTPELYKAYVTAGAMGNGGTNYTGTRTVAATLIPQTTFKHIDRITGSPHGPNGDWGQGSTLFTSFDGFTAQKKPGRVITRVEAVLRAYVPVRLGSTDDLLLQVGVGTHWGNPVRVENTAFDPYVGTSSNAGTIYVDLTSSRSPWQWSDFDQDLRLKVNQSNFASASLVYYDAIGLRVTTAAGTDTSGGVAASSELLGPVDASRLTSVYNSVVGATNVWNQAPGYVQGQGVTVAVVDSGILKTSDIEKRLVASVSLNPDFQMAADKYGHGTHVSGIVAGNGNLSAGNYVGTAPKTNLANVKVSNDQGMSTESIVIKGLQWVLDNKDSHNIKVVNLSLNSSVPQSYHTSPLCAAVEILWFNGITVVVSAGNNGTANLYPPANDPFVITVGATDDMGTATMLDDTVATFSAYGTDENNSVKPDLVAPGRNIISLLPDNNELTISVDHPNNRVNEHYFRMSGTSMAAPVVAGAVAMLLQDEPNLTPDQVKYRLKSTAVRSTTTWPGYSSSRAGSGYLNIYAAVNGTSTESANTGLTASQLLWSGSEPINWGSVNWNSVNWNSVNWNSVNWNSVNWNSDHWDP